MKHRIVGGHVDTEMNLCLECSCGTWLISKEYIIDKWLEHTVNNKEIKCTCHPDDAPPVCQHRYALSECLQLYKQKH